MANLPSEPVVVVNDKILPSPADSRTDTEMSPGATVDDASVERVAIPVSSTVAPPIGSLVPDFTTIPSMEAGCSRKSCWVAAVVRSNRVGTTILNTFHPSSCVHRFRNYGRQRPPVEETHR